MSHDQHTGSPQQILHDGCAECEDRGEDVWTAIAGLDHVSFARAWERAAALNKTGLPDISTAEANVLRTLWVIQVHFERRGLPIGQVPTWW